MDCADAPPQCHWQSTSERQGRSRWSNNAPPNNPSTALVATPPREPTIASEYAGLQIPADVIANAPDEAEVIRDIRHMLDAAPECRDNAADLPPCLQGLGIETAQYDMVQLPEGWPAVQGMLDHEDPIMTQRDELVCAEDSTLRRLADALGGLTIEDEEAPQENNSEWMD